MTEETAVSVLRQSSRKVGRLYPVLMDKDGNVIDGQHRLEADPDWPRIKLNHIGSERERLLARLISNVCRRTMPAGEKSEMLERLGKIYIKEGEKPARLGFRIAEETGMSYRWVMKYLPNHLKENPGLGGPSLHLIEFDKRKGNMDIGKVAHRATLDITKLLSGSEETSVLVRSYANASFVNLMLEKAIYERYERVAGRLGIAPETIISNTMIMTLKEIEKVT